jgi:acetylornithine deacetylase/succinyl-diaminopimelate desuccinylase-like protein
MLSQIRTLCANAVEATGELATTICRVPAPTGNEGARAAFVATLLEERGYQAETDEVGNVYARRGNRGGTALMLLAHTDTVFPEGTDLNVVRVHNELHGPAIGDNSLGVAAMISALQILDKLEIETDADIIAVANVGEEGLGNLRGARAAVERYQDELGAVVAIEGHNLGRITHIAVGSKRWRVTVRGPGGHSWGAFGQPSAIHGLGRIIAAIAEIDVPTDPRTTFNVGIIDGGTSINTIAPVATALIDMRSVDSAALDALATRVGLIIESSVGDGLTADVETLGERPAGARDKNDPLINAARDVLSWLGMDTVYDASSTDANVPIGLNIPSFCIGITHGGRGHTIEEFIALPPVELGLAQLVRLCVDATALISSRSS